jgi:hypothetical protein
LPKFFKALRFEDESLQQIAFAKILKQKKSEKNQKFSSKITAI